MTEYHESRGGAGWGRGTHPDNDASCTCPLSLMRILMIFIRLNIIGVLMVPGAGSLVEGAKCGTSAMGGRLWISGDQ